MTAALIGAAGPSWADTSDFVPPRRPAAAAPATAPATPVALLPAEDLAARRQAVDQAMEAALAALERRAAELRESSAPVAAPDGTELPPSILEEPKPDSVDALLGSFSEAAQSAQPTPPVAPAFAGTSPGLPVLFEPVSWAGGPFSEAAATRKRAALLAGDAERPAALLDLARFQFAWALAEEGAATVQELLDEPLSGNAASEAAALWDAFDILLGRTDPEMTVFADADPGRADDKVLWLAVAHAERGNWLAVAPLLVAALDRVAAYPDHYRRRFLPTLAEAAVEVGRSDLARRARADLDVVAASGDPDLAYIDGRIAELEQRLDDALVAYDLASVAETPRGAVAARRATELRWHHGRIDAAQAAALFEQLRFGWRGDAGEIQILLQLADAYQSTGRYDLALDALAELTSRTPDRVLADQSRLAILDTLRAAMSEGATVDPMVAVALFDRHHRLLPDDAEGIALKVDFARRLAERGLAVAAERTLSDLLGSAPEYWRAEIGTILAEVRLDAGDSAGALAALDTAPEPTDPGAAERRALLRAKAFAAQAQPLEALAALAAAQTPEAHRTRADILRQAGEWGPAAAAYRDLVATLGAGAVSADLLGTYALAAYRAGDLVAVRDIAARWTSVLDGTRWKPMIAAFASQTPVRPGEVLSEVAVRSLLTETDAVIQLVRPTGDTGP